jgi:hypothetical protein
MPKGSAVFADSVSTGVIYRFFGFMSNQLSDEVVNLV